MRRLVRICLLFSSLFLVIGTHAQTTFPTADGERSRYDAYIELSRAFISGICALQREDGVVNGCLFNEFGITALDFTYYPERKKVKLHHVLKAIDKWYIRRVLRKDLAQLFTGLQNGETRYRNDRQKITYLFTPIEEKEMTIEK